MESELGPFRRIKATCVGGPHDLWRRSYYTEAPEELDFGRWNPTTKKIERLVYRLRWFDPETLNAIYTLEEQKEISA